MTKDNEDYINNHKDYTDKDIRDILHELIDSGNIDAVKIILKKIPDLIDNESHFIGGDPCYDDRTLSRAVKSGNQEIIDLVLSHGGDFNSMSESDQKNLKEINLDRKVQVSNYVNQSTGLPPELAAEVAEYASAPDELLPNDGEDRFNRLAFPSEAPTPLGAGPLEKGNNEKSK